MNGAGEILLIIGRVLIGGLFVAGGIKHFFIVPMLVEVLTVRGVPAPKMVLIAGSVFQTVAGLLLIFGILVPWAALGLIMFTIAASIMMLNFWDMEGAARDATMNACISNLAIVGGLLLAAAQSL